MTEEKRISLASKCIKSLQKKILKGHPGLMETMAYLQIKANPGEPSMSTDGKSLFYNPGYILQNLKQGKKGEENLLYMYMHILVHCFLGHPVNKILQEEDPVYDWWADYETERFLKKISGNGKKIKKTISFMDSMDILEDYENVYGSKSLVRMSRRSEEIAKNLEIVGKKLACDDHHRWNYDPDQIREWKVIFENLLNFSNSSGETEQNTGEVDVKDVSMVQGHGSNYRRLLEALCKEIKEQINFEDLEYDMGMYMTGIRLYGNRPLVEPSEFQISAYNDLVIALDVSGSCTHWAGRFLRETFNILRDAGIRGGGFRIWLLECDDEIQRQTLITGEDDIPEFFSYRIRGWGGTDFVPVFELIQKKREDGEIERISGLIYLTDGDGTYPETKPDYPVFFLITGPYETRIPDWIQTLELTERDIEKMEDEHNVQNFY